MCITLLLLIAVLGWGIYSQLPHKMPVYAASDHYDPQTQIFENYEPQSAPQDVFSALWQMTFDSQPTRPNKPLPVIQPDWQQFLAKMTALLLFGWGIQPY